MQYAAVSKPLVCLSVDPQLLDSFGVCTVYARVPRAVTVVSVQQCTL